jgi:hypothetical protein
MLRLEVIDRMEYGTSAKVIYSIANHSQCEDHTHAPNELVLYVYS